MSEFYSLNAVDSKQSLVEFSIFKNNVVIISNVATYCKLAKSNYDSFKQLTDEFYDKGLRVLLFPCSQFLNQESGDIETIRNYAHSISDKFIVFDKVNVFGSQKDPVFKYLTDNSSESFFKFVKWNFTKWVVKDGKILKRYGPTEIIKCEDIKDLFE